jgi:hypothetical protein
MSMTLLLPPVLGLGVVPMGSGGELFVEEPPPTMLSLPWLLELPVMTRPGSVDGPGLTPGLGLLGAPVSGLGLMAAGEGLEGGGERTGGGLLGGEEAVGRTGALQPAGGVQAWCQQ